MSTLELSKHIGQTAVLLTDGLRVSVKILDVKQAYGRTRYQVTPVNGSGTIWVEISRLIIGIESEVL